MNTGNWFAFRVTPQKEKAAHEALERAGIRSLFAHERHEIRKTRHKRHDTTIVDRPLLTGYALAYCDDARLDYWLQRVFSLMMYAGPQRGHVSIVRSVVGINGQPYAIPPWAISHLMNLTGALRPVAKPKSVTVGQSASLKVGPFAGHTVKVEAIKGQQARVLLGILGSTREITVRVDTMEAA
jgi:transcription antitermination factor NusG